MKAHADDDLKSRVAAALKRYYEDRLKQPFLRTDDMPMVQPAPPPWTDPIKQLAATKPEERVAAAAFLQELLGQALEHERSGKAPWRSTPYWGGGADVPARDLRERIAEDLAKANVLPDALPVLRWYLTNERHDKFLEPVMAALAKLDGKDADALRVHLATMPHENVIVVAEAFKQIAERKVAVPAEKVLPLCQDHHAGVRVNARALIKRQGGTEPRAFDPVEAMRSPEVRRLLKELDAQIIDGPPATAQFIVAKYVIYDDEKKMKKRDFEEVGWVLKEQDGKTEIYTPYGSRTTIRVSKEPTRDSDRESWWTCSIEKGDLEKTVARIEKTRKEGAKDFEFSESGGLTGQFQGTGASLYEIVFAQRLHAAGDDARAARILFPALDTLYRDKAAIDILRHGLGEKVGYEMLVAFVGDRDFGRAERLAKALATHYPKTRFHGYAVRLAEELPKRRDDFVKFKLPTPAEWNEMKKKLTREQQIDFLAERYRLLNYFQMGQPGGYLPGDKQYAEPCGMTSNASWGLGKGKTEVINPEVELEGVSWRGDDKKPRGLGLTLKDVPQLSKFLRDDWLMPTVTFWRDFHPNRHLGSTRPHFASMINGLARHNVCKVDEWNGITPAEIDKEIDRINRWARDHANKTEGELDWEALNDEVASGTGWAGISGRIDAMLRRKDARAFEVMKQYLEKPNTDAYDQNAILNLYIEYDVQQAKEIAPKFHSCKHAGTRLSAAIIAYQTGDKARARVVFGDVLESGSLDSQAKLAAELLLKDKSEESQKQLIRLFANKALSGAGRGYGGDAFGRAQVLGAYIDAGFTEPYRYYLAQLDNKEVAYTSFGGKENKPTEVTFAEIHAGEIVTLFKDKDPAVKEIAAKRAEVIDQIPALKKWLQSKTKADR
jgi:hypothetical protein